MRAIICLLAVCAVCLSCSAVLAASSGSANDLLSQAGLLPVSQPSATFEPAGVRRRYTVPALAASRRVFAPCLLGFGWSDKPLVEYNGYDVWPRQLAAFIREVGAACRAQQSRWHVLVGALLCCSTSGG